MSLTEALLVKERASSPGVRNVTAHGLAMMQAGKSPLGEDDDTFEDDLDLDISFEEVTRSPAL